MVSSDNPGPESLTLIFTAACGAATARRRTARSGGSAAMIASIAFASRLWSTVSICRRSTSTARRPGAHSTRRSIRCRSTRAASRSAPARSSSATGTRSSRDEPLRKKSRSRRTTSLGAAHLRGHGAHGVGETRAVLLGPLEHQRTGANVGRDRGQRLVQLVREGRGGLGRRGEAQAPLQLRLARLERVARAAPFAHHRAEEEPGDRQRRHQRLELEHRRGRIALELHRGDDAELDREQRRRRAVDPVPHADPDERQKEHVEELRGVRRIDAEHRPQRGDHGERLQHGFPRPPGTGRAPRAGRAGREAPASSRGCRACRRPRTGARARRCPMARSGPPPRTPST